MFFKSLNGKYEFIILGLICLAGCQSELTTDDKIDTKIAVAIHQGQPAEKIEQLVLQADNKSKSANMAVFWLMRQFSIPTEIEKNWSYYRTSDTSTTPSVEIFEIINRYKISVLRVLIPYGINLNQNYFGDPLIFWGPGGGNPPITPELLTFLLENGYNPNLSEENPSPLASCTWPDQAFWRYEDKYKMIKDLLRHGANPNVNCFGKPILHQLIIYNNKNPYLLDIVKLLLETGAEVNAVDQSGYTPLDKAWQSKGPHADELMLQKIIECLESYGGKRSTEL